MEKNITNKKNNKNYKIGYYSEIGSLVCSKCPDEGVNCGSDGVPTIQQGYYRPKNAETLVSVVQCLSVDACPGGVALNSYYLYLFISTFFTI